MNDAHDNAAPDNAGAVFITISPAPGGVIRLLEPERDAEAAAILAASTYAGIAGAGQTLLERARADEASAIYAMMLGQDVVAVYITRKIPLSVEVTALAVADGHRRQGYGRACMTDALRRAGKLPLVVETDDDALGFYKRCGFKLVGRRVSTDGRVRYRLGWHAPGLRLKGESTAGNPKASPSERTGPQHEFEQTGALGMTFGTNDPLTGLDGRTGWEPIVDQALTEDIGMGDVTTTAIIPVGTQAAGAIIANQPGIVSGLDVAGFVFRRVDPTTAFQPQKRDGDAVSPGDIVATITGTARSVLTAERVALNLLQRLSGVATMTRSYVEQIAGTRARIVDTRKTTPGMRLLEKAAVRHGGGFNHRFGLADGVLIKDNHLAAIGPPGSGRVGRAVSLARGNAPHTLKIEIEVTTLAELGEAIAAKADVIMLDNMDIAMMRRAVEIVSGGALLEASGGIVLANVRAVAETGVDLISVGALTHSAPSLDLSLELAIQNG